MTDLYDASVIPGLTKLKPLLSGCDGYQRREMNLTCVDVPEIMPLLILGQWLSAVKQSCENEKMRI